ncbi:MAG TPA: TIGR01244 family sulfur transferase [Rhodopila sp.]|nr:TIGR01244 family sulfur transferase [Rhodopila sp.]
MSPKFITHDLSVSPQLAPEDMPSVAAAGFRAVINTRPDGEEANQPSSETIRQAAVSAGLAYVHLPVVSGRIRDADVAAFGSALQAAQGKVLAFCRSGTRAVSLWALTQAGQLPTETILAAAGTAGYDLAGLAGRLDQVAAAGAAAGGGRTATRHDVVIVGGGAAGLATAASLRKRDKGLDIAVIEPRQEHYYQPGWTMVGAGVFDPRSTCRSEASVMPAGVTWIKAAVTGFRPEQNAVVLEDGRRVEYRALVVAPGIALDWGGIEGLAENLGRNGVTSNYSIETAPYTWELVRQLKEGVALFTQPPMPIKCAGAPQKAMYLACDYWQRHGRLGSVQAAFHNAGAVLFGVKEYVPPLMRYIERYAVDLQLESRLVAIDGPRRQATFAGKNGEVTREFAMLHVCPPQKAPAFMKDSPLGNAAGYVEVDETTLLHVRYPNVFGLGDGASTSNAKTAAAARQQAPVVAVNVLDVLAGREPSVGYDGYGSCPLTVERGKIVLAEFGYGGKLMPTFPKWLIDGQKAQRLSWWLKAEALPFIYWNGMLKGHEWLASPKPVKGA